MGTLIASDVGGWSLPAKMLDMELGPEILASGYLREGADENVNTKRD